MNDLLAAMTAARVAWTSPRVTEWAAGRLTDRLCEALRCQAGWVGDLDFGSSFRDGVRGLGAVGPDDPAAWANRLVDLGDGDWCITGIRFRGLDVTQPFVDVVATNLPPSPDALSVVADAASACYEEFAPRALRVDAPCPYTLVGAVATDPRFRGCSVDQYVLAAPVPSLRSTSAGVGLRAMAVAAARSRVARLYQDAAAERPDLARWAAPARADELEECAEQGLLFEVTVEGEAAGVVAARREDDHAMTGFCVVEIVLDTEHRGTGLGPAVLRRLGDVLPAGPGDTLWGSIHPENHASLRSALAAGREVVGGSVWVVPRGMPGLS